MDLTKRAGSSTVPLRTKETRMSQIIINAFVVVARLATAEEGGSYG